MSSRRLLARALIAALLLPSLTAPAHAAAPQKRWEIVLVNFQDTYARPFTAAQILTVARHVATYYRIQSGGALLLAPSVLDWTAVERGTYPCDYGRWTMDAFEHADPNYRDHTDFFTGVAAPSSCHQGYGGPAGNGLSFIPFDHALTDSVYAHELGHSLGFNHAGTPKREYGDPYDPMGDPQERITPLNAVHKSLLGWPLPAYTKHVRDIFVEVRDRALLVHRFVPNAPADSILLARLPLVRATRWDSNRVCITTDGRGHFSVRSSP